MVGNLLERESIEFNDRPCKRINDRYVHIGVNEECSHATELSLKVSPRQIAFGRKIPKQGSTPNSGGASDVINSRLFEPVLKKKLKCHVANGGPGRQRLSTHPRRGRAVAVAHLHFPLSFWHSVPLVWCMHKFFASDVDF
jgi:hypothetical protein